MKRARETLTVYVSPQLKARFVAIQSELSGRMNVSESALAHLAIVEFVEKYEKKVDQIEFNFGLKP